MITHNLLRAAPLCAATWSTCPPRFAAPARKPMMHLPANWPWQIKWKTLWHNVIGYPTRQPRAA